MRDYYSAIEAAATYICLGLHPAKLRSAYVEHISVAYRAELIVYALQALSTGMTALFVGLLTNYLYDKARKKHNIKERAQLKRLIAEQKKNIKELEKLLAGEKQKAMKRHATLFLTFHKEVLIKVERNDPSVTALLKKTVIELNEKGKDRLQDHAPCYSEGARATS